MNNNIVERNITLDYFKIILATLVITIHIQPLLTKESLLGWLVSNGIARIAVPCFFVINGYYIQSKINNQKSIGKYILRLLTIYLTWALIYLPFTFVGSVKGTLLSLLIGYYHLWYIPALIIGVAILFFLKKIINNNYILLIFVMLLYIVGTHIQDRIAFESDFQHVLHRNGLLNAFPFVFVGYFIAKTKDTFLTRSLLPIYIVVSLSFIGILVESYIRYFTHTQADLFISFIFFCPSLVLLVLKHSKMTLNDGYIGLLSSGIYFTHWLVIILIKKIFVFSEFNYIYTIPLILLFSGIMSAAIIQINKRIKIFL